MTTPTRGHINLEALRDTETGQLPSEEQLANLRASGYTITNPPVANPGSPHETAYTHTKLLRAGLDSNQAIAIHLQILIENLTYYAKRDGTTILANTIRLEARPAGGGTEFTIRAFAKQNPRTTRPVDNTQTPDQQPINPCY